MYFVSETTDLLRHLCYASILSCFANYLNCLCCQCRSRIMLQKSVCSKLYPVNCTGKFIDLNRQPQDNKIILDPFPNNPWFLHVCRTSLLKTLWEKEELLITSNSSFSHSVFYLFREFSAIFSKFEIFVSKIFLFGRV